MSFFLWSLQLLTILTVRVEWINNFIKVPLFSNIEEYRYLPEARIYVDDLFVSGAEVTYERNGVEWTYISTVNTNKVRRYGIKYRAYFPRYHIYHVQTITFDVIDEIPPEIIHVPEKKMNVNEKIPDLTEGMIVSDNYYDVSSLVINTDTSRVNTNVVGTYQVIIQVSDPSGNMSFYESILRVIDPLPPFITQNKPIIISCFQSFSWQDYFTIKDNVDTVLSISIEDSEVNYEKIGTYLFQIIVVDRSHNQTIETFEIKIQDLEAPKIMIKSKPPDIDVFTNIDRILLESYILEVSDNYDVLSINDVNMTHDIESSVLGTYNIYCELKDASGNITNITIPVKVCDHEKPIIRLVKPLEFDVFSNEPLWLDFMTFHDNYTDQDHLTYKITTSPKMNIVGKYPITIEVIDSSLNKAIYQDYIHVIDFQPPTIKQLNEIIITDFEQKDYRYFFELSDQYDKPENIDFSLDDHQVNYDVVGTYEALAIARDRSNNETIYLFEIFVIDMIEPTLELKESTIFHNIGDEALDFIDFILTCSDNYDVLTIEDVDISYDIKWNEIGRYIINYSLYDSSMNRIMKNLEILIDDKIPPVIKTTDLYINRGEFFDEMMGVDVSDNVDVSSVLVYPNYIDTNQPGSYVITYVVTDVRGNYVVFDRNLIIQSITDSTELISYVPVIIIIVIGGCVLYVLYKKR